MGQAIVTDLVLLEPVLNYKLLLDGSLSAPAWEIGILVGEGRRKFHTFEKMFVIGFAYWVERVDGSLGIKRVFVFGLVFFGE